MGQKQIFLLTAISLVGNVIYNFQPVEAAIISAQITTITERFGVDSISTKTDVRLLTYTLTETYTSNKYTTTDTIWENFEVKENQRLVPHIRKTYDSSKKLQTQTSFFKWVNSVPGNPDWEPGWVQERVESQFNIETLATTIEGHKVVPEPLSILGTGTALVFGVFFKRQLSKKKEGE